MSRGAFNSVCMSVFSLCICSFKLYKLQFSYLAYTFLGSSILDWHQCWPSCDLEPVTQDDLPRTWCFTNLCCLLYHRLTSESSDVGLVVKEASVPEVLSPGKWQHVVLSYLEDLDGSTLAGKVGQVETKPSISITKIKSKTLNSILMKCRIGLFVTITTKYCCK